MDRRRLQEAFFQYALLKVASWYPKHVDIEKLYLHDGLSDTLLNVTPHFHKALTENYTGELCGCSQISSKFPHRYKGSLLLLLTMYSWEPGNEAAKEDSLVPQTHILYTIFTEHRCEVQGCGTVMVLDGNMKNNREVCFAVDAGYVEFSGLPGRV